MSELLESAPERALNDTQIAWLEGQPGHWLGRAQTRRESAECLRREQHVKEADYCLKVASEYEQKAAEVAKGTN